MRRVAVLGLALAGTCMLAAMAANANDIASSTMHFEGTLTGAGGGVYHGVIPMIDEGGTAAGYDIYALEGGTAWFGNDPGSGPVWTSQAIGADHDAWPTWTPDTPDWYQYSLHLHDDGGVQKWAVRNHAGATADHPWYDEAHWGAGGKIARGVPLSGVMHWSSMFAAETDVGAYLPGTGTPEIPGGAASKGGGAGAWDMDWSWGSEVVPLERPGFEVAITDLGGGNYSVTLAPAGPSAVWVDDDFDNTTPGWGVTRFASIQDGVNAVVAGGTVHVAAGSYGGSVTLNKSLTLAGANAGIHPAVGTHPSETVGTRGAESILTNNYPALRPQADDVTVDGFMFTGQGGRIIDTYSDANNFHLTNCIFDNDTVGTTQGVVQLGGGSHAGLLIDFNLFQDRGDHTLYFGGGPYDGMTIEYNKFNVAGESVFWAASPLVDGVIRGNEFDGTLDGTPGAGFCTINIGQGGNILIEDNWFHDLQYAPFQVGIIGGSVIGNTIERIYPYPGYWGSAFELWGGQYGTAVSTDVTITDNTIHYNDVAGAAEPTHGMRLRAPESGTGIDGTTIHAYHNSFLNGGARSDAYAVRHQGDPNGPVDAEENYWDTLAYGEVAGLMEGNVDFEPWCNADFSDCTFAGPVTTTYVDDDYAGLTEGTVVDWPYGSGNGSYTIGFDAFATIQGGVDGVSGSTVNVAAGTYAEAASIDTSVTIEGAGPAATFVNSTGATAVFTVTANDVTISQMTITNPTQLVEGIRVDGATSGLTLDTVHFTNLGNNPGGGNAYGVNVQSDFSGLSVADCEFVATNLGEASRAIGIFAKNNLVLSGFAIADSMFEYLFVGVYLRTSIDGLDITGNTFGPFELDDCTAAVAGVYIGDGSAGAFDLMNISITGNDFVDYGRGVYVWNYAPDAVVDNFVISGNTFADSIWSAGIRFIIGLNGFADYTFDGVVVDDNVFTQSTDVGANVALIDFRTYDATLVSCDLAVTDNQITFSGGPYTDAMYGISFLLGGDAFYNAVISRNAIDGGTTGGAGSRASAGVTLLHYADDYTWAHDLELAVTNNVITGFDDGASVFDAVDATYGGLPVGSVMAISNNSLAGNGYGARNDNAGVVDASGNWWGDTDPSDNVSANVDYSPWLDTGSDTSADPGFQGDFTVLHVDDDSPQTGSDGYITEALGLVSGSTINVAAGTYVEQVHITMDDLNLVGAGAGQTIIESPVNLTASFATGSNDNYPVVFVDSCTGVELSGLTVDGANQGDTNVRFIGVAFWNAGGSLVDAEVLNIMNSTFSGAQHGVGIYAYNNTGGPYDLAVNSVVIDEFQKNAMALMGAGLTVDLDDLAITGAGVTDVTAQNGIQIAYGAGGTVDNCSVSGFHWDGPTWTASGVLLSEATTVDMTGVSLDACQVSVYAYDTSGSFSNGSITNGSTFYGILAYSSGARSDAGPRVVCQPLDPEFAGMYVSRAPVTFAVQNATISGTGATDSVGIYGYAVGPVDMDIQHCMIDNWDYGVFLAENGGTLTGAVNYNQIAGNLSYGLASNMATPADAEYNYWGAASGPVDPNGVDEADNPPCFDPATMINADGAGDVVSDLTVDYCPWLGGIATLALEAADCQDDVDPGLPGHQVAFELHMRDLLQDVTGFQAFLAFDDAVLDFEYGTYTMSPFGQHIPGTIVAMGNQIDISGSTTVAQDPTSADALLATFVFTVDDECATTGMTFRTPMGPFVSELSLNGVPVATATVDSPVVSLDDTDPTFTYCPDDLTVQCMEDAMPGLPYGVANGGVAIHYNDNGLGEDQFNQAYLKAAFGAAYPNTGAPYVYDNSQLVGADPSFSWYSMYTFSGATHPESQFGFDLVLPALTWDGVTPIPTLTAYDYDGSGPVANGTVAWAINDYKPHTPDITAGIVYNSLIRGNTPANPADVQLLRSYWTQSGTIFTSYVEGKLVSDGLHHWYLPGTPDSPLALFQLNGDFYFSGTLTYDSSTDTDPLMDFYAGPVTLTANHPNTTGYPLVIDNCTPVPAITYDDVITGGTGCNGDPKTITRTWTATDDCGNTAQCVQVITVEDTEAPLITGVQLDATALDGSCESTVSFSATVTDNCCLDAADVAVGLTLPTANATLAYTPATDLTVTQLSPKMVQIVGFATVSAVQSCPATVALTINAADCCGNAATQASATVDINDSTPPVITQQPADATVECDGTGIASQIASWLANNGGAMATDTCSAVVWSDDFDAGNFVVDCGGAGYVDVTFTATDGCGNSTDTDTVRFTIEDTTPPTITNPAEDRTVECDGTGLASQIAVWLAANGNATATDDCSGFAWSNDFDVMNFVAGCGGTGSIDVTFTVTDDCGNPASTTATFTIADVTAPVVTCSNVGPLTPPAGTCTYELTLDMASAMDLCEGALPVTYTVDVDGDGFDGDDDVTVSEGGSYVFPTGVTNVRATATDDCGNSDDCDFTVEVEPYNDVVGVAVELEGVDAGAGLWRCIKFIARDTASGTCAAEVHMDVEFFGSPAVGVATFQVDCGMWDELCAKDEQHTLYDSVELVDNGTEYVTNVNLFLRAGDTDNDSDVDIHDVTWLMYQWGQGGMVFAGGCPWDGTRDADFSNDGFAGGTTDYVLLSNNWHAYSVCPCAKSLGHGGVLRQASRARLSATELSAEVAAVVDMNQDGLFDYRDVQVFEEINGLPNTLSAKMELTTSEKPVREFRSRRD